jgi:hypothetical protein
MPDIARPHSETNRLEKDWVFDVCQKAPGREVLGRRPEECQNPLSHEGGFLRLCGQAESEAPRSDVGLDLSLALLAMREPRFFFG